MAAKVRTAYLSLPQKQWVSRATLVLLVLCGMSLMVMSKTHNPLAERLRTQITDVAAPVLAVAASPMSAVQDAGAWVSDMVRLREENVALRNQNIQLLQWQAAAKSMREENESLHKLLNVVPAQRKDYITVRMVSDVSGPFVRAALIEGGSRNGIKKDEAVIDDKGLIGRVVETGASSARVLLLGDINSRIPVMAERAHEKSILAGNNGDLPTLDYLSADSKIKVGDRIVTSGDGGVFPQGVPVGVVTSVAGGKVRVQPFADAASADYVSVVDYSF